MLKRLLLAAAGLLLVLLLIRAPEPAAPVRRDRLQLGTLVTVKLYGEEAELAPLAERAFAQFERVDSLMSRYRDDSEARRLEEGAFDRAILSSPELREVLERSLFFAQRTEGAFDPTVGALTRLWGFPEAQAPPDSARVDSARALVGYRHLRLEQGWVALDRRGVRLDLGAVAKGYAVDLAVEALQAAGAAAGLVEAGGDIRYWGEKPDGRPWLFGVQHPRQRERYLEVEDLDLKAIATSGDYEQFFEYGGARYHHILDPQTGYPARATISATVWAATAMDADIMSTAVFVLGPVRGLELVESLPGIEALVFYEEDGQLMHRASSGVKGRYRFAE